MFRRAVAQRRQVESSTGTPDPLVGYMLESNQKFKQSIQEPLGGIWKDLRALRDLAAAAPAATADPAIVTSHGTRLLSMIEDVQKRVGDTRGDSIQIERRLKKQSERVAKKFKKKNPQPKALW